VTTWIGIDVSKLTLDICWFDHSEPVFLKVPNGPAGFKSLLSKLPALSHLVMEATELSPLIRTDYAAHLASYSAGQQ
jgi:transposase